MSKGFEEFLAGIKKLKPPSARMDGDRTRQLLVQANDQYGKANEQVRAVLGSKYFIDEMALYFPEEKMLYDFMKHAVQNGWRLFNVAEDNVTTEPITGVYTVEYWFLEHELADYRLELMWLPEGEGYSPYHGSLHYVTKTYHVPALAHASFKVSTEIDFGNAIFHLTQAGYQVLQHCASSYGKFSYLRNEIDVPIKPRLNVRDRGTENGN